MDHRIESERKFTDVDAVLHSDYEAAQIGTSSASLCDADSLAIYIARNVVGADETHHGPYEVLPLYGNTHSSVTVTSEQSTLYVEEARNIIRNAVHASEHDCVIFESNGTTGAVNLLVHSLNFDTPPVFIVGPFEHHSNLLTWIEACADLKVHRVKTDKYGLLDQAHLQSLLSELAGMSRPIIGCFSACSNLTGTLSDIDTITVMVHKSGGLVFWDYAAAAPYVHIFMNPVSDALAYKDAVFFSGHKFVGGPQTPGVLIAKKSILKSSIPRTTGGGTVFFVRNNNHIYLKNPEKREEGGTPSIVGNIRLGLHLVSVAFYHKGTGLYLHHNFVTAVLDDLFGIQTRAGCMCAGPYAQEVLGISEELAAEYEGILLEDPRLDREHLRRTEEYSNYEMLRPGVTRFNLPFFANWTVIKFIVEAVKLVAEEGWKLLPQYKLNPDTGEWHHVDQPAFVGRKWLGFVSYDRGYFEIRKPPSKLHRKQQTTLPKDHQECLQLAQELLKDAAEIARRTHVPSDSGAFSPKALKLKWFLTSFEAKELIVKGVNKEKGGQMSGPPFVPKVFEPLKDENFWRKIEANYQDTAFVNENENVALRPKEQKTKPNVPQRWADSDRTRSSDSSLVPKVKSQNWNEGHQAYFVPSEDSDPSANQLQYKWFSPPSSEIFKPMSEAISEFDMIKNDDRILVCLSGGKDSLSLLHSLHQYQYYAKGQGVRFELGAVTIDPGSPAYDPSPLIDYISGLKVPYFYERQNILEQAKGLEECASICAFCSRMKRGRLYATARREAYNVLAFGHHLDDLAESFLMSAFFNGALRTIKVGFNLDQY